VTCADPWRVAYIAQPPITRYRRTARIPWALYYPIDSDCGDRRLPPGYTQFLEKVDLPIAQSRYGQSVLQAHGFTAAYIPAGVDTKTFQPPDDKVAAKRALGYGDRFVILCDARNQKRKLLPRALEIFRRFAAGKKDVQFNLHCDPRDPAARLPD
jgi:glycosyltransferase involved in cell wall biosynthesis